MPEDEEGGGSEGGGVSAGHSTDEESEGKIFGGLTPDKEHCQKHKDNGKGVVERSDHGLTNRLVDERDKIYPFFFVAQLTNAIINDDGVMNRERKNGENCSDKQKINLDAIKMPQKRKTADENYSIVKHSQNGTETILELLESITNIEK